ncbi:MAG: asparagine synthase (glutamine-hydrolyzing), partial [Deltaproteobacteria bacterium]
MCSILGYFGTSLSKEEVAQYNAKMAHRGKDFARVCAYDFAHKKLYLAHNRLSIQDLSANAHQPMENERFALIFNGEIYNHLELRKLLRTKLESNSDTQTLLACFSELGVKKTLELINGMFAIALFDKREQKLYLMRDRVGAKPLYYTLLNGEFAFASELKALSAHLKQKKSLNAQIAFVSLGYIPGDKSYYEGVYKLLPAHYLVFDGTNYKTSRYWDLPQKHLNLSFNEALERAHELIIASVKRRLIADVDIGVFLSGGIDSSLISAIAAQHLHKPLKSFCIGFEDNSYDESTHAKTIAKHLQTEHHEYIFSAKDVLALVDDFNSVYDEPFGDASALAMLLLAKATRNEVKVALSGDGGDELFCGYERYFLIDKYYKKFSHLPMRRIISAIFAKSGIDKLEKLAYPMANLSYENLYSVLSTSV